MLFVVVVVPLLHVYTIALHQGYTWPNYNGEDLRYPAWGIPRRQFVCTVNYLLTNMEARRQPTMAKEKHRRLLFGQPMFMYMQPWYVNGTHEHRPNNKEKKKKGELQQHFVSFWNSKTES